jgi:hypothetical protein
MALFHIQGGSMFGVPSDLEVLMALHPVEWRNGTSIQEMINQARRNSGRRPNVGLTFYNTLGKFEETGLAEGKWGDDTEIRAGARMRRYRLTSDGYRRRIELGSQASDSPDLVTEPA